MEEKKEENKKVKLQVNDEVKKEENKKVKLQVNDEVKKEDSKKIKLQTYKELKKIKGTFKNIESSGMPLTFSFRGNWKGPPERYTLMHGFDYELPLEVVNHLNGETPWGSCTYKKDKWITVEGKETSAQPINISSPSVSMPTIARKIGETKNRFMFLIKG